MFTLFNLQKPLVLQPYTIHQSMKHQIGRIINVVTIIQAKGGSGKTTLAMTLASAALAKGQKVHMFDGDVNRQLITWPEIYQEADWGHVEKLPWPENLSISEPSPDIEQFIEELDEMEEKGIDIVIIDTQSGISITTENFALLSDLVLIPAKPEQAEYRLVLSSFQWMADLHDALEEGERFPAVRAVLSDVPTPIARAAAGEPGADVPKRDMDVLQKLMTVPHLNVMIPSTRIFAHFFHHGPLPLAEKAYRAAKNTLMANHFEDLLAIAIVLHDEMEEAGRALKTQTEKKPLDKKSPEPEGRKDAPAARKKEAPAPRKARINMTAARQRCAVQATVLPDTWERIEALATNSGLDDGYIFKALVKRAAPKLQAMIDQDKIEEHLIPTDWTHRKKAAYRLQHYFKVDERAERKLHEIAGDPLHVLTPNQILAELLRGISRRNWTSLKKELGSFTSD